MQQKNYFPAGKKPKVKAGTITCVNALYEIKRFNFSIIVPPFIRIYAISLAGALSRNRTSDTRIFSPLLYRLSYQGIGDPEEARTLDLQRDRLAL